RATDRRVGVDRRGEQLQAHDRVPAVGAGAADVRAAGVDDGNRALAEHDLAMVVHLHAAGDDATRTGADLVAEGRADVARLVLEARRRITLAGDQLQVARAAEPEAGVVERGDTGARQRAVERDAAALVVAVAAGEVRGAHQHAGRQAGRRVAFAHHHLHVADAAEEHPGVVRGGARAGHLAAERALARGAEALPDRRRAVERAGGRTDRLVAFADQQLVAEAGRVDEHAVVVGRGRRRRRADRVRQ